MLIRNRADVRTLIWAFIFMPGVPLLQYFYPQLVGWMLPLGLYLGFSAGVLAHNQNHCPTFKTRRQNAFYSAWLSIFYGYPIFGWIPTHNLNHHKYVNRAGDASITWRVFKKNSLLSVLTYFFISNHYQGKSIVEYLKKAKAENPKLFGESIMQYVTAYGGHVLWLSLAVSLHGWRTGLFVYAIAVMVPTLFALWSMFFINYIQHVDCDAYSRYDHSRSFVSPLGNFFVFNAGYHLAHHELAGLHWSKLPALNAKLAPHVNPELQQHSIFWFCFKTFILGTIFPSLNTKLMGEPPWEEAVDEAALANAPISALGAGSNEARAV